VARGDSQLHERVELMATEAELIAAIRAEPDDDHARLVFADWLLERGDARGELLQLEHADRHGAILHSDVQLRLLELAAVHGFLRIPDEPALEELRWEQHTLAHGPRQGNQGVEWHIEHLFVRTRVRWHEGALSIATGKQKALTPLDHRLTTPWWTTNETHTVRRLIDEVMQRDRIAMLRLPSRAAMVAHARLRVRRDHERWCDGWDRFEELSGNLVDRPRRSDDPG
jgi:uncharacterized protein (TIGR02996 family)